MSATDKTEEIGDLFENAPCGFVSVDPDGRIAATNKTFTTWAALPRDALMGSRFHDCLHIASRVYYETHLLPLLRIQGFVNEVALDFHFGNGARLPTLVNFVERRRAQGALRHIRMTIFNASDRRRYEKELVAARTAAQAAREDIRQLNEALKVRIDEAEAARLQTEGLLRQSQKMEAIGQLTGGIAHDFNNLLAGITGILEILERRLEQGRLDSLPRHVAAARAAAKRAATLTHRLLAFSRRQKLEPQATDVNRVLSDLEELIRRSLGAAVQFNLIGARDLWTTVVDRNQLENAVLNVSMRAMPCPQKDSSQ